MRRNLPVLLAAVALCAAATSGLHAWVAYTTSRWSGTASFTLNRSSVTNVSASQAAAAIQTAMNAWNNTGANVTLALSGGDTNAKQLAYDGVNAIFFRQDSDGGAIATNYTWWDGNNHILDSDIVFWNAGRVFFTGTSGCSNGYYIEDIAAHELGHSVGLDHSYFVDANGATATMYPSTGPCDQTFRTLSSDDIAGIRSLYGASSSPPAPSPPPSSGNTAPSLSITSPANGTSFAVGTVVTLTALVIDAEDGNLSYRTAWTDNGTAIGIGSTVSTTFNVTGTHTIEARVNDNYGVVSTAAVTITIGSSTLPPPPPPPPPSSGNTAPSLSITSPANGATFALGTAVTLTASVIDAEDGNLSYRTAWTDNGVDIGIGSTVSTTFNVTGTHTIGARVNDNHGVVSTATVTITVGSSPTPPPPPPPPPSSGNTAPSLSITSPANGATFALGTAVTLTASVIDAEDGNLSYRTAWTDNGTAIGIGSTVSTTFTVAGTHTIGARVNDNHGVVSTATVTITIR
jgi:plastocyanin